MNPGVRLGAYEVMGEIGRGGMGVVLRGRGPDGRDVAIKVLLKPGARDALPRFEREMRLLAAVGGEEAGFVPLLASGESREGPWLAMPFVGGGTLRDQLDEGPLPIDRVVTLGRALADALGRAHEKG